MEAAVIDVAAADVDDRGVDDNAGNGLVQSVVCPGWNRLHL